VNVPQPECYHSIPFEVLRCPKCHANLSLDRTSTFLECDGTVPHRFLITEGIPSFVSRDEISPKDAKVVFEYDETAEKYDEGVKTYDSWLGVSLEGEYRNVVAELSIGSSQRILDVSTGTGAMIFRMREAHPNADPHFIGIDLSFGMLKVAQRKFVDAGIEAPLFHTKVNVLPFADDAFDVITCAGGINTFEDIPGSISEWVRTLKPNGTLLIVDEGLSPSARRTQRGLEIVNSNKLFGMWPPLEHMPPLVKNIALKWIARDTFYALRCQKLSDEELKAIYTDGSEEAQIRKDMLAKWR